MLVMLVAAVKTCYKGQVLVAGSKQNRQAGWLTRQSGLPALFCAQNFRPCFQVVVLQNNMS
jgi:hypothetical protein